MFQLTNPVSLLLAGEFYLHLPVPITVLIPVTAVTTIPSEPRYRGTRPPACCRAPQECNEVLPRSHVLAGTPPPCRALLPTMGQGRGRLFHGKYDTSTLRCLRGVDTRGLCTQNSGVLIKWQRGCTGENGQVSGHTSGDSTNVPSREGFSLKGAVHFSMSRRSRSGMWRALFEKRDIKV